MRERGRLAESRILSRKALKTKKERSRTPHYPVLHIVPYSTLFREGITTKPVQITMQLQNHIRRKRYHIGAPMNHIEHLRMCRSVDSAPGLHSQYSCKTRRTRFLLGSKRAKRVFERLLERLPIHVRNGSGKRDALRTHSNAVLCVSAA